MIKWLRDLFKKEVDYNFSDIPISVDMHSHLLPELDDGVQSLEESLDVIENLNRLGYRKLITTPHVMGDFYKNSPEDINAKLTNVREGIEERGLNITLEAAAEYYLDEWLLDKVREGQVLSFGDNYLLVETSFMTRPAQLLDTFFQIKVAGYKPVFAHPERYIYLYEDFERYREIYNNGIYFQINLNSLMGYYSPDAKYFADSLIAENMVDFVGTDTHRMSHVSCLNKVTQSRSFPKLKELNLLNETL